ncbi:MAG: HAMP domain-containing sensor histidine kinase [Planctomycetota bacterium]|nr:HAMP domain-containing sensor histidine kinase [Planctomycetota bacterium]
MLARWPIRNKLLIGIGLLLIMVSILSISGFCGAYAYRGLVKSLRGRAEGLDLATTLSQKVSDLRATLNVPAVDLHDGIGNVFSPSIAVDTTTDLEDIEKTLNNLRPDSLSKQQARQALASIKSTFDHYQQLLDANEEDDHFGDGSAEREIAKDIRASLDRINAMTKSANWDTNQRLHSELQYLHQLTVVLPGHLHRRLGHLADDVRTQYHSLIAANWTGTLAAIGLLALIIHLFYRWIFRPLRVLVKGSRHVAAGEFSYRIQLHSKDEMGELADSMNDMTARFQAIRDDLDRQVQLRTKQVVRSEQLASVGFLAAGVAHEINNPLASIAMCAESLEGRLVELCQHNDREDSSAEKSRTEQLKVMEQYLRLIQTEAFRCKGITEKLLDFSRIGDVQHQPIDLHELVTGVIEMVRHIGKYQDKQILFDGATNAEPVIASANAAEIKQVVLNLITNALDSLEAGGSLCIELQRTGNRAELVFADNGCGMSEEVLSHLFEPFFTRKRGGQGTGLGLSIVYRIIADHGGQIEAESEGPGHGSRFRVTLPLAEQNKENRHRYQAA